MNKNYTMMVSFYESENKERNKEIVYCLEENAKNKHITKILVFNETELRPVDSNKIEYIDSKKRMTYKDYFEYANKNLSGQVCILANADIVVSEDIEKLNRVQMEDVFICLSRWNESGETREAGADSQDTWVFKSPVREGVVELADYHMGTQFCDNVLSYLAYTNGYVMFNPSEEIITRHVHSSEFRTEKTGSKEALELTGGKYSLVHPTCINGANIKVETHMVYSFFMKSQEKNKGVENELERTT